MPAERRLVDEAMRWSIAALVATLFAVAGGGRAAADEWTLPIDPTPPAPGVLQNRTYDLLHEITLLAGGLPTDPYAKGLTGTVGYTLHFSDFLAWELAQLTYVYSVDTKLKKEVLRLAGANGIETPHFPRLEWIAASHFVVKPFYGKEALFNTEVLHLEGFAEVGPALVSRIDIGRTLAYGVDAGVGARLWLSHVVSLRLDMGELVYFVDRDVTPVLHVTVGLAFNLRGAYE